MSNSHSDQQACANRARTIGQLETPRHWAGHVVCAHCEAILSSSPSAAAQPPPAAASYPPVGYAPNPYPPPPRVSVPSPFPPQAAGAPAGGLACGTCGGAFGVNELTEEHGRVVCRACALQAAASGASHRRRRARNTSPAVAVAAGVLLAAGVTIGVLSVRSSRPATTSTAAGTTNAGKANRASDEDQQASTAPPAATPRRAAGPTPTTGPATNAPSTTPPARAPRPAVSGTGVGPGGMFGEAVDGVPYTDGKPSKLPPPDAPPPTTLPPAATADARPTPPAATADARPTSPAPAEPVAATRPTVAPPGAPVLVATATPPRPAGEQSTPRRSPATAPSATTAPSAPAAPVPATPLGRGVAALAAGNAQAAVPIFQEMIRLTPRDPNGFHGLGLAYHQLNQGPAARQNMERALAASLGKPGRTLVWNFAAVHAKDEPMRGARVVRDHLTRTGGAVPDEDLLNLLGASVFGANDAARATSYWLDLRAFYMDRDAALASAKGTGQKRWGSQWTDAASAGRMWQTLAKNTADYEQAKRAFSSAFTARKRAWDRVYDLQTQMRLAGSQELPNARAAYAQADRAAQEAGQRAAAAQEVLRETQQPSFPERWDVLPIAADAPASPGAAAMP